MFIPAYLLKTDRLTDISYSLTFIFVALVSYFKSSRAEAHSLALMLILLWATRLGGFLFIRINKIKVDHRFDEMRHRPWAFFRFWFFQGLTVFVVLLSALLLWNVKNTTLSIVSWVGVAIFITGLALEAFADAQKFKFNNKKTKDAWIDQGVWRISRHPNYLGEVLVWVGVYLFAYTSLSTAGRFVAMASPIYIAAILLFFSGVPLLEKSADKKWGSSPDYRQYKKSVPLLIPSLGSLRRLF